MHKVKLIDRPVSITIARMWAAISTWDKLKLCGTLVRDRYAREGAVLISIRLAKETYNSSLLSDLTTAVGLFLQKRLTKETYKRDLQKRPIIARERALLVSIRPAKELL